MAVQDDAGHELTENGLDDRDIAAAVLAGPDAVIAADAAGLIVYWNPGAERIFGYRAAEAIGTSLDLIIPQRLRARHWQGWQQVMSSGQSRYGAEDLLSVPSQHRDGTPLSVEFTIHPVPGPDGTLRGIAATLRDATARFHQLRELRRKLTALESAPDD